MSRRLAHTLMHVLTWSCIMCMIQACYFFRKKGTGDAQSENSDAVLGNPLGPKAAGPNYESLEEIYGITTSQAPAAIRPDPDTYIRSLLLQYRQEGSTVAREIGRVEAYRPLLGGASDDFAKEPQDRYDATSLLASIKVAEELCRGLVAPSREDHPGWSSILPSAPNRVSDNIRFLAQRFTGMRSSSISSTKISALEDIFDLARGSSSATNEHYIPVCTALSLDAEGLLL